MYPCVHDTIQTIDFDKRTKEIVVCLMSFFVFGSVKARANERNMLCQHVVHNMLRSFVHYVGKRELKQRGRER